MKRITYGAGQTAVQIYSTLHSITARSVAFIGDEIANCDPARCKEFFVATRPRIKQILTLAERLAAFARRHREEAALLPQGELRALKLQAADRCDRAAEMNGWLRSKDLSPPE